MKVPCVVIGGGLSGLAAAIRLARFTPDVLLLEQHSRLGGLNSYYYRNKSLFETGLHAITNYAEPSEKRAPLNRLLRQLKLNRKKFIFHQQKNSKIVFDSQQTLLFSNDFTLIQEEIRQKFPASADKFNTLCTYLEQFDPFKPTAFISAKLFLREMLDDDLLVDMLLCPLMYYGSSVEDDMDLAQFAIMFQAIYKEGFFRPNGTIKDFLVILTDHFQALGGTVQSGKKIVKILRSGKKIQGVQLQSGEVIECDYLLSTIGLQETRAILDLDDTESAGNRLGFVESIFQVPLSIRPTLPDDTTVLFYNSDKSFSYRKPERLVDFASGVICMPFNFEGWQPNASIEVRSTHLASYEHWAAVRADMNGYEDAKLKMRQKSLEIVEKFVGKFSADIIYEDTFTPITIERYTAKKHGAIYGSPHKIKDGDIGFTNLFLAGTDQGFLGIVGSMLSGVSIVNQHILPKL